MMRNHNPRWKFGILKYSQNHNYSSSRSKPSPFHRHRSRTCKKCLNTLAADTLKSINRKNKNSFSFWTIECKINLGPWSRVAAQYGNFDLEMEVLAFRASGVKKTLMKIFSVSCAWNKRWLSSSLQLWSFLNYIWMRSFTNLPFRFGLASQAEVTGGSTFITRKDNIREMSVTELNS